MSTPSEPCPSENQLAAFAEGQLPDAVRPALHAHPDRCPDCRAQLAALATDLPDGARPAALRSTTALPPAPPPGLPPGVPAEFDEYRLLANLGRGAMGVVFLAEDTLLERQVAIQWIAAPPPAPAPPRARGPGGCPRSRFLQEARAIARLQHPNGVSIYRVGQVGGHLYLVSEYVPG